MDIKYTIFIYIYVGMYVCIYYIITWSSIISCSIFINELYFFFIDYIFRTEGGNGNI